MSRFSLLAFISVLPFVGSASRVQAEDIYVAQAARGVDTGVDASNAHSVEWFNNSASWGAGTGKISPGDTVHLCGNVTSNLRILGSGSSNNAITILFEPGATMSKPAWSGYIIDVSNQSWIIIDGGATGLIGGYTGNSNYVNGIIESTQNGTGLANTENATGIYGNQATFIVVRHLVVRDLYVRRNGSDSRGNGAGVSIRWSGGVAPSDWAVTNCVFKDMSVGFFTSYGPGSKNILMSHCTAFNVNWGGAAGDHGSTSTLTNLVVRNCYFHDFVNWDQPGNQFHHNGFYVWAESGGKLFSAVMCGNVIGPNFSVGWPNNATSGLFLSGAGAIGSFLFYNNLFIENANGGPANGNIFVWPAPNSTTRIFNNTFVGSGGGNAIQLYGSHGGAQTYELKNNLCIKKTFINLAYSQSINLVSSSNLGYNLPIGQEYSSSASATSAFKNLAQWQSFGYDLNAPSGNPNLDASYTPLPGSSAMNAGADLSGYFVTDNAGWVRMGAWDIGAFERPLIAGQPAPPVLNSVTNPVVASPVWFAPD